MDIAKLRKGVSAFLMAGVFLFLSVSCTESPAQKPESKESMTMLPSQSPQTIQKLPKNPVMKGADPFILLHDGVYYLYSTNAEDGYLVYTSSDLQTWESRGHCLKKEDVKGSRWFWAPEVMYYQGKFYMVYTADEHLGIAVADSPLGPFRQEKKSFLSETKEIDGHFFQDDDGSVYLYFVRFPQGNVIYGAKMNADMLSYDASSVRLLLSATADWETKMGSITEGPSMLKRNGTYYLTYSANHYESQDYAIGYATSSAPLSGFQKYEGNPILSKSGDIVGTGHHSFTTSRDGTQLYIVYHRHYSTSAIHPRLVCIDKAMFEADPNGGKDLLKAEGPT